MGIFARQGHTRFILCVGYEGRQIADYFCGAGALPNTEVCISDAGLEASKSERIKLALEQVKSDRFMLSYGDDLAKARSVALEAVRSLEACDPQT